ncbi:hypothetical protein LguiA_011885 [Lonicera macranthoides]
MATIISMEPSTSNPSPNPNPNPNSIPTTNSHPSPLWPNPQPITSIPSPFKASHRRRDLSDIPFRVPYDVSDPFNAPGEDIGSDEDIFSKYIDVEKLCESGVTDGEKEKNDGGENGSEGKWGKDDKSRGNDVNRKGGGGGEIVKSKKAMPANRLAELWVVDPKRAKRILANRQSAARSKERKARYIVELEKKVQSLEMEATTLATQLTLYQRDVADLAAENAELKLQLQTMEHQIQLREDLNEALKREVERLRIATGEMRTPQQAPPNLGGTQLPYAQACNPSLTYLQIPQSSLPSGHHNNIQLPLFPDAPSRMPTRILHQANNNPLPPTENLQNEDPFSCSQGFDISNMEYIASPSESNRAILLPPTSS